MALPGRSPRISRALLLALVLAVGGGCAGGPAGTASEGSSSGASTSEASGGVTSSGATQGDPTSATATEPATSTTSTSGGTESGGDPSTTAVDPPCAPEIDSIYKTIFLARCGSMECHDSVQPAAGLNLVSPGVADRLVGVAAKGCPGWLLVTPGAPADSLLVDKVAGSPSCGAPMPVGGEPLDDALLACLGGWIDDAVPTCETCGGLACVDLKGDPDHCGECDTVCPPGASCAKGSCACPQGQDLCVDGCADLKADSAHCGGCDIACPKDHVCAAGECALECGDLTPCDGVCVDVEVDPANCGGCGLPCAAGTTCQAGACVCGGDLGTFAAVQPILATNCAMPECHGPPTNEAGLDLSPQGAWASLVGVTSLQCGDQDHVVPGDPAASYLVDKLLGVKLCDGLQMPKQAPPLGDAELAAITGWICAGAPKL